MGNQDNKKQDSKGNGSQPSADDPWKAVPEGNKHLLDPFDPPPKQK